MSEEMKDRNEQGKIILPKELQVEMMKFFLKTSIPRKKRLEMEKEQSRLSNTDDRSEP